MDNRFQQFRQPGGGGGGQSFSASEAAIAAANARAVQHHLATRGVGGLQHGVAYQNFLLQQQGAGGRGVAGSGSGGGGLGAPFGHRPDLGANVGFLSRAAAAAERAGTRTPGIYELVRADIEMKAAQTREAAAARNAAFLSGAGGSSHRGHVALGDEHDETSSRRSDQARSPSFRYREDSNDRNKASYQQPYSNAGRKRRFDDSGADQQSRSYKYSSGSYDRPRGASPHQEDDDDIIESWVVKSTDSAAAASSRREREREMDRHDMPGDRKLSAQEAHISRQHQQQRHASGNGSRHQKRGHNSPSTSVHSSPALGGSSQSPQLQRQPSGLLTEKQREQLIKAGIDLDSVNLSRPGAPGSPTDSPALASSSRNDWLSSAQLAAARSLVADPAAAGVGSGLNQLLHLRRLQAERELQAKSLIGAGADVPPAFMNRASVGLTSLGSVAASRRQDEILAAAALRRAVSAPLRAGLMADMSPRAPPVRPSMKKVAKASTLNYKTMSQTNISKKSSQRESLLKPKHHGEVRRIARALLSATPGSKAIDFGPFDAVLLNKAQLTRLAKEVQELRGPVRVNTKDYDLSGDSVARRSDDAIYMPSPESMQQANRLEQQLKRMQRENDTLQAQLHTAKAAAAEALSRNSDSKIDTNKGGALLMTFEDHNKEMTAMNDANAKRQKELEDEIVVLKAQRDSTQKQLEAEKSKKANNQCKSCDGVRRDNERALRSYMRASVQALHAAVNGSQTTVAGESVVGHSKSSESDGGEK